MTVRTVILILALTAIIRICLLLTLENTGSAIASLLITSFACGGTFKILERNNNLKNIKYYIKLQFWQVS